MSLNIIPSNYFSLPKDAVKFINKIKSLYGKVDTSDCYLYIKPTIKNIKTTAVLIDPLRGISIIGISVWTPSANDTLEAVELLHKLNNYYQVISGLLTSDSRLLKDDGTPCYNFYSKIIFTRLSSYTVEKWNINFDQSNTTYISSEQSFNLTFELLFSRDNCSINTDQVSIIRSILFPEIKIKDVYNTIKVLDAKQEQFAKSLPNGHYIVSGVPGSGKTVMLIARAIHLLKENSDWKIKVVTYNRSLNRKIKSRLKQAYIEAELPGKFSDNISVTTFSSMAIGISNLDEPESNTDNFWRNEVVEEALKNAVPTYDAILIDEYQDFYDKWIALCIKVTKIQTINNIQFRNIFLAGDRLQSIFNPNENNWRAVGINFRGRSKLLKHTYRTGGSIIDLALKVLMADIQFKDEVQKFYDGAKGISSTSGIPDIIEYIHGDYSVVVNLVRKLINEEKYKPEEILILFPGRDNRLELYSLLPKDIQDNTIVTKDLIEGKMLITTYHSAKGLENRICILMDIDKTIGRKLTYVGMTRAFQYLYIHSKNFIDLNTLIDNIPGRLTLSDILDFDINNTLLFKTTDDFSF